MTPVAGVNGPGITPTSINVGIMYSDDADQARNALGQGAISQGDIRRNYEILINDLNKRGGIRGRKVVPVWHTYSSLTVDANALYSAACADFTQDHKVFAAFLAGDENFRQCLENAGVTAIDAGGLTESDGDMMRRFPHVVELASHALDRLARGQVSRLRDMGYFGSKAKVGIVTWDYPGFRRAVKNHLVPSLRSVPGVTLNNEDVVYVRTTGGNQDAIADIESSVLKMNTDGVTHMLLFDLNAAITLYFSSSAKNQQYYPRYGLNSQNGVQALLDAGLGQPDQFRNAVGIGWLPLFDTPYRENPPKTGNAARQRCLKLLNANGVTFADSNAETIALGNCSTTWFFERVAGGIPDALNRDSFMAAVERLGSSYVDPITLRTSFGPGKHLGASSVRPMRFVEDCSCVRYIGPITEL